MKLSGVRKLRNSDHVLWVSDENGRRMDLMRRPVEDWELLQLLDALVSTVVTGLYYRLGPCSTSLDVLERLYPSIVEDIGRHWGVALSVDDAIRSQEKRQQTWIREEIASGIAARFASSKKTSPAAGILELIERGDLYPPVPTEYHAAHHEGFPLPSSSGVYFVKDASGTVAYVGQSIRLCHRAKLSHEKIEVGDRVAWLEFDSELLNWAEAYYIGICRPYRNFGAGVFPSQELAIAE